MFCYILIVSIIHSPCYIFSGNIDVYICPGDHLALSEPEDGAVVGQILAAAVGLKYRTLRPTLPRVSTTFKERRSIHKFEDGVDVLLYSKKGMFVYFQPPDADFSSSF